MQTETSISPRSASPDSPVRNVQPNAPCFDAAAQAWRGPEMALRPEAWEWPLDARHVEEIEAAVDRAARKLGDGDDLLALTRADFPLPTLAGVLARIRREALHGIGFALVRGLPVARHDARWGAIAFWGLGLYLGEPVSQNAKGHALGHVKDLGLDYAEPDVRGYQTRARLPYHTDYSDLVCLLCLKPAVSGGLSTLVSSVTLYNEMRRQRPDLADALAKPVCRSRWGEVSAGQNPWLEVPVFNLFESGVSTTYTRSAVRKAQRMPGVPALDPVQDEAMDYLDSLAMDPAFHLDMTFRPGDFQVVNNHCIMHSRTAYEDAPSWEDKRHLLRLWLACEDGPPYPQGMTVDFQGTTPGGRPNGIHIEGVPLTTPLDAC